MVPEGRGGGAGGEEKPVPNQREKVKSNNNKDAECGEMVNWGKPNKAKEKCNLQKPEKKDGSHPGEGKNSFGE
ncbi:hypothetical protein RUM43_012361 [Polyplax serrata]|uniref:Uncharacterized protein n=1 Tax=Polyplax serrata TaxID=468196 RepID=A0AAN8S378_POLSC